MKIIVLTPVRVLGEGLAACLSGRQEFSFVACTPHVLALRDMLERTSAELVLVDVTQGVDLDEIRSIALERPALSLVALGLHEQQQDVIRCGRAGFVGYISRETGVDTLCEALADIVRGRLHCSADISGGLLRALFGSSGIDTANDAALTKRERQVLQLIARGLSNKQIARELSLSAATVKRHVHGVLSKLRVTRRAEAMRRVHESPWLTVTAARLGSESG